MARPLPLDGFEKHALPLPPRRGAWPSSLLVRNASDSAHTLGQLHAKEQQHSPVLAASASCTKLDSAALAMHAAQEILEGEVLDLSRSPSPPAAVADAASHDTPSPRRDPASRAQLPSPPRPIAIRSATAGLVSPSVSPPPTVPEGQVLSQLSSPSPFPALADPDGAALVLAHPGSLRLHRAHTSVADGTPPRRASRRSSARSGATSMSPASMFLSQWNRAADEGNSRAEPDDEGQEFGDRREFVIGRQLGYGGFSVVKEAFTIEGDARVTRAVKIVRKHVSGKDEAENERLQHEFEHEVSIWRHLSHANILPLLAVCDTPFATFCVTRLNRGGTLFDLVRACRKSSSSVSLSSILGRTSSSLSLASSAGPDADLTPVTIPLATVKSYLAQLAAAVRYLHQDAHIVHRDIKLENCLIDTGDAVCPGKLLLCDFGMADYIEKDARDTSHLGEEEWGSVDGPDERPLCMIGPSETSTSIAGSLPYAAPEMILAGQPLYRPCIDIWAYGVIAYALLTTQLPFSHSFAPRLQMMISKGEWNQDVVRKALQLVDADNADSEAALDMIRNCLCLDPGRRWDVAGVLASRFLAGLAFE